MLKERLRKLFENCDPTIRQVVNEVGELEQQYLTMKSPMGIRPEIDLIITRIAKAQLEREERSD